MIRRPPSSTRTDTLFPYTTLFRSVGADAGAGDVDALLEDQNRWRPAQLDPRGPGPQQLHLPDESDLLLLVVAQCGLHDVRLRSEEHTSELQSLMRISYAVFCLKKKKQHINIKNYSIHTVTET